MQFSNYLEQEKACSIEDSKDTSLLITTASSTSKQSHSFSKSCNLMKLKTFSVLKLIDPALTPTIENINKSIND